MHLMLRSAWANLVGEIFYPYAVYNKSISPAAKFLALMLAKFFSTSCDMDLGRPLGRPK